MYPFQLLITTKVVKNMMIIEEVDV